MTKPTGLPRYITTSCHGTIEGTCPDFSEVTTPRQHAHDAVCPRCKARTHVINSTRWNKKHAAGNTTHGKTGPKAKDVNEIKDRVYCKACHRPLIDCLCMDVLDGIDRINAIAMLGLR